MRVTVTGSSLSTASASGYEIKVYGMAGGTPGSTITRTEAFVYDADGNRVGRSYNGQMTVYHDGLWEDTLGVNARKLYRFGGQIIAQREQNTSVSYLLGDHLGSTGAEVDGNGTVLSYQRYMPWGEVRDGNHTLTSIDFTGQRRDDSGLLFSNARYYDPKLARFLSADTVVPGNASGGMDGVAYRPLTVAFHAAGFAERLNAESAMGLPFQQDSHTRQQAGSPWGASPAAVAQPLQLRAQQPGQVC